MDGVRYGILGTTQAHHDDGTPVALGGARLRALLAALALRPGRVCSADALIAEVWDAEPGAPGSAPRQAGGALQALIGRLRKAIGRTAIVSVDGGYLLRTDPDSVDLFRFERLARDASGALADGDPGRASDLLDQALALWRGPALADLPSRTASAARAEARHLDARRDRARADLALGRAAHALPALTELCGAHPLDEPLHALRIRALRDTGRAAEALAAYEQVRRELVDRLGTDPGPELRALHAELLTPDAGRAPTDGSRPAGPGGTPDRAGWPGPGGPAGAPGPSGPPDRSRPTGQARQVDARGTAGENGPPDRAADRPAPGRLTGPTPLTSHDPLPGPDASSGATGPDGRAARDGATYREEPSGRRGPEESGHEEPSGRVDATDRAAPTASAGPDAGTSTSTAARTDPRPHAAVSAATSPGPAGYPAAHGTADPPVAHDTADPPAAPAAPGARRPVGNLRASLTSFVGRERDLHALRADLGAHRLITLLGPGGSGKTRLSKVAAASVADDWPDGAWLAELAPAHDPDTVVETVLTTLGARETVIRSTAAEGLHAAADRTALDPLTRLTEHCAARRMLLVLDNCEHVIEVAARLAETLLAHCPGVTVLATSREPLAVPGEVVRSVEPLPQPVALRLLADRGASARPGFRVEDDLAACAEICRRLDGLPLAIELAAARLRLLSPRQLADRLDDRFRLLTTGSRTLLPRQQTLRAVVDWSWDLLDARERAVLRRLSVFAGGCDLAAAEAVCADDPAGSGDPTGTGVPVAAASGGVDAGVDPRDVAALLGSLVDKSLVVAAPAEASGPGVRESGSRSPTGGRGALRDAGATGPGAGGPADPAYDDGMRYRLLETVAEYAAERLDEAGERAAVERRHLVAYRELARRADPLLRGAAQGGWLWRLELEHENLRTALRRAVAAGDEHEALCLVLSLNWFWHLRDHRADLRTWAAAVAELGPNPFQAPVTPAPPLLARVTDAPPPLPPDQLWEARRSVRLIGLALLEGDLRGLEDPDSRAELRGVVEAYRPGLPQTCRLPGSLWFIAPLVVGDSASLREIVDASVRTGREIGDPWELAFMLQLRAKVLAAQHNEPTSLDRDIGESLEIFARLGDSWGAAEALSGRGAAREERGEYAAATDDYQEAIGYAERLGAQTQVWLLRARLAGVMIKRAASPQEAEQGVQMLIQIMTEGQRMNTEAVSYARLHYAVWCAEAGRFAEARAHFEHQLTEFGGRSHELFQGIMEGLLGWLDTLEGRPAEALRRLRGALVKTQSAVAWLVAPQVPIAQLVTGAHALTALGGADRARAAARLIGAHDALFPPGVCLARTHQLERAEAERSARAELTDARYEQEYAAGRGLSLAEAAALV
ncbi:BTAD domain-containing putative transcriptional regulator [Streptomyces buecherae]|uniref:AfsR/SARP family transcriptional regulator n=1 Tax=Streptomyces buecherae TaxID=2763006 RepID=UPI0036B7D652